MRIGANQAIDLAVGERLDRPSFRGADGLRLDRPLDCPGESTFGRDIRCVGWLITVPIPALLGGASRHGDSSCWRGLKAQRARARHACIVQLSHPEPDLADGVVRLRRWEHRDLDCVRAAATDPRIPQGTSVPRVFTTARASPSSNDSGVGRLTVKGCHWRSRQELRGMLSGSSSRCSAPRPASWDSGTG